MHTAPPRRADGVALQHPSPSRSTIGMAALGCPFDTGTSISQPCVVGFWADATKGKLTWKTSLANSQLNAGVGPPSVFFSADGEHVLGVYTGLPANASTPPSEYLAAVAVADGSLSDTLLLGPGQGHGVHISQPDPAAKAPPAQTNALVSLPGSSPDGRSEFHVALTLDEKGKLNPNNTPLITCNGTSSCAFLAASSDLSLVLVDAVPTIDAPGPNQPCAVLPTDAERWGFAMYKGKGVSATMPTPFATEWAVCAASVVTGERRALNAATIVVNATRVVAVFSHLVEGTTTSNGVSACCYDAADGSELWCTKKHAIDPPSLTAITPMVTSHDDGLVAVGVAGVGILGVDASSATAPEKMEVLYSQGDADDCCAATALEIVGGSGAEKTIVASIPVGA